MADVMYHVSPTGNRNSIEQHGLDASRGASHFSGDSSWAHEVYGCAPVYLSAQPGRSADTRYSTEECDIWRVDTVGLALTADLPGLYDAGANVEPGIGMWFEEKHAPALLLPFEDGDGILSFAALCDAAHPAARAAIRVTHTAALGATVSTWRLQRSLRATT